MYNLIISQLIYSDLDLELQEITPIQTPENSSPHDQVAFYQIPQYTSQDPIAYPYYYQPNMPQFVPYGDPIKE